MSVQSWLRQKMSRWLSIQCVLHCVFIFVFYLELRENLTRFGANLKQKFVDSVRETWATINDFARAHTAGVPNPDELDAAAVAKDTSDTESQSMYLYKYLYI